MTQWVKNLPAMQEMQEDASLIPGSGRSPGGEKCNPLQYSCLENPMDRQAWWAIAHRLSKARTQLKQLSTDEKRRKGCQISSLSKFKY